MNLIEHIADHLDFEGLGKLATIEEEGNLFWGAMPDQPDLSVCVFSTDSAYGGSEEGARIQIMTRGAAGDVRTPYELSCEISEALQDFNGYLHGDGPKVIIETLQTALGAGIDTSGRHIYSSNYKVRYCGV
ncbi:MAG: minor capsid protein [Clostridium sp.]|nr:minor capsid protein [Clostridium sp.]